MLLQKPIAQLRTTTEAPIRQLEVCISLAAVIVASNYSGVLASILTVPIYSRNPAAPELTRLTLKHVEGAFLLMAMGLMAATLGAVIENVLTVVKRRRTVPPQVTVFSNDKEEGEISRRFTSPTVSSHVVLLVLMQSIERWMLFDSHSTKSIIITQSVQS